MTKHTINDPVFGSIVLEEIPPGADPEQFLRDAMHDCPECRAARARGEVPQIVTIEPPSPAFRKRPRWRTMKRR